MARYLLLNAGANNHGATQEILDTIRQALPEGSEVEPLCLGDTAIAFCQGCKVCYDTGRCAVEDDDMQAVIDKMDAADVLVIAAPSYWADIPGQFKVFIDRCTVYGDTNEHPDHRTLKPGKRCYAVALRTGGRPVECEHIIETIAHWCGHMQVEMAGSMYFCRINDKGDIEPHKEEIIRQTRAWMG